MEMNLIKMFVPIIGIVMIGQMITGGDVEPTPPDVPEPPLPPPGKANLYGRVQSAQTGGPIAGVQCSLDGVATETDAQGDYAFIDQEPATYNLQFYKEGYETMAADVTLHEGNNRLDVLMAPIAPTDSIGDLNDDGVVNVLDLTILERYIAGFPISQISPLSEAEFMRRADVNGDGSVNSIDITAIEILIAGGVGNGGVGPGFYWLRPTGHVSGEWDDPELAYDGLTDTRAEITNVGTQSWCQYLELTIPSTEISAVRWWGSSPVSPRSVQVIAYYGGSWHDIYDGSAVKMWDEGLPIPGGAQAISKVGIRFYNPSLSMRMKFRVNEIQLYGYAEEPPPGPEPAPTTRLSGTVTDKATGVPVVAGLGTIYQDYDSDTDDYEFITNSQGYYEVTGLLHEVDVTKMVIYAEGYLTHTDENVSISEGDNVLNIQMTRSAQVAALSIDIDSIMSLMIVMMMMGMMMKLIVPRVSG